MGTNSGAGSRNQYLTVTNMLVARMLLSSADAVEALGMESHLANRPELILYDISVVIIEPVLYCTSMLIVILLRGQSDKNPLCEACSSVIKAPAHRHNNQNRRLMNSLL
jgi:hypothetical protein